MPDHNFGMLGLPLVWLILIMLVMLLLLLLCGCVALLALLKLFEDLDAGLLDLYCGLLLRLLMKVLHLVE